MINQIKRQNDIVYVSIESSIESSIEYTVHDNAAILPTLFCVAVRLNEINKWMEKKIPYRVTVSMLIVMDCWIKISGDIY